MQIKAVENYLSPKSTAKTPFFLFVGDTDYASVKNELAQKSLDFVPISQFCASGDKIPDVDELINYILESDVNVKGKRFVITGLGEYLALKGSVVAEETLRRLWRCNVGGSKVILLLRGVVSQLERLKTDQRFDGRCHELIGDGVCSLSFIIVMPTIWDSEITGFKKLLSELEYGRCGNIVASTAVEIDSPMFNVRKIKSAYEVVIFHVHDFPLPVSCGTDAEWAKLIAELAKNDNSLDCVFKKYGFEVISDKEIRTHIGGNNYSSWLYFVFLKCHADSIANDYLRYVLDKTNHSTDLLHNLLKAIIDVSPSDAKFATYYKERKILVSGLAEHEVSDFIVNNRIYENDCIYRLTDNTLEERKEIIDWIARNKTIPKTLGEIYPMLETYLRKYVFKCPESELAALFAKYFEAYKLQKVTNELKPEFVEEVNDLAHERKYTALPSRNEVLDKISKDGTNLYWLDALGVEYLAFIEGLAKEMGLSISISVARSELPTITTKNSDFFHDWQGFKYDKNPDLDDTKHHQIGGYSFTNNKNPIHLAKELDIIYEVIGFAATELGYRKCSRFLIVSDHGASRLAVLCQKEEPYEVKYETDTKPEASGRCCKLVEPYDLPLPFAAVEDGYLVLADYGRFKGSRRANVEVHGGASLEEVIVPIIELSLKEAEITVTLVYPAGVDYYTVDFKTGGKIELFFNTPVKNVSVVFGGKSHQAAQTSSNHHYAVELRDLKRAGDHTASVYVGDNLIGVIMIKAQGKSGKVDKDFDDLF